MTPKEKLAFVQDLTNKGSPAFAMDYGCHLEVMGQDKDGRVKVDLINGEDEDENHRSAIVDVVDTIVRRKINGIWMDVNQLMLVVDLGGDDPSRIMNPIPHNLFAVMYT